MSEHRMEDVLLRAVSGRTVSAADGGSVTKVVTTEKR